MTIAFGALLVILVFGGAAVAALVGASPIAPLPASAEPGSDDGAWLNYLFSYNVTPEAACKFRDKHQR